MLLTLANTLDKVRQIKGLVLDSARQIDLSHP